MKKFLYKIENATDDDFLKILEIKNKAQSNTYQFAKNQFIVARDNGKMIGFARIREDISGKAEIGALFVDEKYRGQKIGYDLMDFLIKNSQHHEFFIDADKGLETYYKNFGFQKMSEPEAFQMKKIREIYEFYGDIFDEKQILAESVFMKIEKNF